MGKNLEKQRRVKREEIKKPKEKEEETILVLYSNFGEIYIF